MGMLDVATYTQLQAADAMRDAAQNPSGGAGLTAGIGAGMGIGGAISDALKSAQTSGSAAAAALPDVMTPSEAAKYLQVSEEDVLAAIKTKQIKAKKIGEGYRISREALQEYLKS
jgi:excisionase family DNA binding protein